MNIRLAGTVGESIVDGPGIRFTVFVQGCPHGCPGCHNPHTHDFASGEDADTAALLEKIKANPLLDGVTFSGGEPFCQAKALYSLAEAIKAETALDLMIYTGYTYEFIRSNATEENCWMKLFSIADCVVDGKFEEAQKSYLLQFRGSANQRAIDVKKTLSTGIVTEVAFD
ncbi:MAG: anaerobic ribonucleoside-triphosphate reductase activating protein [Oscillospiraceae bacterium]